MHKQNLDNNPQPQIPFFSYIKWTKIYFPKYILRTSRNKYQYPVTSPCHCYNTEEMMMLTNVHLILF